MSSDPLQIIIDFLSKNLKVLVIALSKVIPFDKIYFFVIPVKFVILFGMSLILGWTYKFKWFMLLIFFKLNLIKPNWIISGGCDYFLKKIFWADLSDHERYSKSRIYM